MRIKGNIKVPIGSTVTFAVKKDIIVEKDVGESTLSSTITNIDGFYSTDNDFIVETVMVEGINDCGTGAVDRRLNIGGAVTTNASLSKKIGKGKFINNRDLCADNLNFPSIYFTERLDLILNAPLLIQQAIETYREVPPK